MFNADRLNQFFSVAGAAWTSTAILALFVIRIWSGSPAMFAQWIAYRRAKAEEKAAEYSRLLNENVRLDTRCIRLEAAEQRCREELSDVQRRLSTLEGYQIGRDQAAGDVTIMEAAVRVIDDGEDK